MQLDRTSNESLADLTDLFYRALNCCIRSLELFKLCLRVTSFWVRVVHSIPVVRDQVKGFYSEITNKQKKNIGNDIGNIKYCDVRRPLATVKLQSLLFDEVFL